MIYTLQKLIRKTLLHGIENPDASSMDVEDINDTISDVQDWLSSMILRTRPDFLCTYFDFTPSGKLEYGITDGLPRGIDRIHALEDISNGSSRVGSDSIPMKFEQRFSYLNNAMFESGWYFNHGKLGFPGNPSDGTYRIWYPIQPKALFYATVTSSTDNTVTLPVSLTVGSLFPDDDYYNGMFLLTDDNQLREIIDYVGSTRTFTVDVDWSTNPANTVVISLVSPISGRFQDLLHLESAIRILTDLESDVRFLIKQRNDIISELTAFIGKEQTQTSQMVTKLRR